MVFWEIIRWLVGEKKKIEQTARYMSPEQAKRYVFEETLKKLNERLMLEAKEALKVIEEEREKTKDPVLRRLLGTIIKSTREQLKWYKDEILEMSPTQLLVAIAAAEAIKKGLHKDMDRFARYLLKQHFEAVLKLYKEIPNIPAPSERHVGWNRITRALIDVVDPFLGSGSKKYINLAWSLFYKALDAVENNVDVWVKHPDLAYQKFTKLVKEELGLDWWDLTPEEILEGRRKPREEKTIPGGKILAHHDRYPTAVQKFLIKALVLGEHQRQDDGVHRNLYRAFRDLISSPLITSNWKPWIADWLERLEKGEKASPLRHLLENLPLNPRLKAETYRYLARIERGESINDIPEDEKKRFLEAVERIKQEIWRNPEKYHEVFTDLAYVKGLNPDLSRKALVGLIHDLAQIYVGRKSPAKLDLEKDATQIYYTIMNLQDLGNYVDPSIVARRPREIIKTIYRMKI